MFRFIFSPDKNVVGGVICNGLALVSFFFFFHVHEFGHVDTRIRSESGAFLSETFLCNHSLHS